MSANRPILSVVIPVYNELDTWKTLVGRVEAADLGGMDRQIILVDDCSTDGTRPQLQQLAEKVKSAGSAAGMSAAAKKVLFHEQNMGKGAALRTGFTAANGDFVIVQDADLEYDPADYPKLLAPLLEGKADVVYGSRFLNKANRRGYLKNYLANRFLTALSNLVTGMKLTDMETCYKMLRRDVLDGLSLHQNRFGFEPEITAKISRLKVRIMEVPISYSGRTHTEGKKISWKDGLNAIWCILKYGLFRR